VRRVLGDEGYHPEERLLRRRISSRGAFIATKDIIQRSVYCDEGYLGLGGNPMDTSQTINLVLSALSILAFVAGLWIAGRLLPALINIIPPDGERRQIRVELKMNILYNVSIDPLVRHNQEHK
jgi:hypothetical protein